MNYQEAKRNTGGFKMISLLDADQEQIKPFNNFNSAPDKQLKEIDELIKSLPEGKYYLAMRTSPRAKVQTIPFNIGSPAPTAKPIADNFNSELHAENLRLAVRNRELETLNEIQEEKIQELIKQNADLLDELEEIESAAESLEQGTTPPSIWESLLLSAAPGIIQKLGLNDAAPQPPGTPGGDTPPPIPGVNVTTAPRYIINPDSTSVPAQVVTNAQQGAATLASLPPEDQQFLKTLAWLLQPLVTPISNDLQNGKIKWQQAKAVGSYLERAENLNLSNFTGQEAAVLTAAQQIGFLMYGGTEMRPIAGNIEQNFQALINWAKR